ncbi:MAG TPA: PQQ-binding-like beta-propeller repeat protein [Solirubrobacteraceae bacterium]|nr:PQQ-binding-like beta-propeller repeat protein [Solirubrobacteraceae bacterium]
MRSHRLGLLAGLLLTVLYAAPAAGAAPAPCTSSVPGGEWPMYGHDVANTRTQPEEQGLGPSAAGNLTPAWVFSTGSTGDGSQLTSTPVVSDGCVFIGSFNGYVYGLDAGTGHVVWQRKLDAPDPGSGGVIVGAAAVYGPEVIFLVDEFTAPYAIALDRSTGAVIWKSAPFAPPLSSSAAQAGSYTNASPIIAGRFVVAGYSPPEGDSTASGGFSLIDATTGRVVTTTPTISLADQAQGYSGGGLWSTPAYDPRTQYLYWGAGNPSSKDKQSVDTDAILKIDLDQARSTFGQIVATYPGNVDQYASALQALTQTPACQASADPSVPDPLDDPVCGQLDLDFGAAANLFETSTGTELVGDLQKSGVYHVANAATMKPAWTALVGASCQACNAASTAVSGGSVYGVGTPAGVMFSLAGDTGEDNWLSAVGDGIHYESTSAADGVVWTVDSQANLDGFDAGTGQVLVKRPLSVDAGAPIVNNTSSGVAIAEHALFLAAGGAGYASSTGYVIAYRAPGS